MSAERHAAIMDFVKQDAIVRPSIRARRSASDAPRFALAGHLRTLIDERGECRLRGRFWLELDGFQIHFGTEDGIDRARSKSHVAYLVSDLDHWRQKITDANIEILDGIAIPNYRRFEFRDPFGNRVEFLEKV